MTSLKWITFAIAAALSVLIGFFLYEPPAAGLKFSVVGYWNILVLFIWFCVIVGKTYHEEIRLWFTQRSNWIVIAAVIVATVFLYSREGGGFKITFDEHTISNVSKSLHLDRVAVFKESALPKIDETSSVDKRPLLFPFLTATVHDILGFRVANAFYVNGILTSLLLLLLYVCGRKLYNPLTGWFAVALACSTPIIGQNSSGGGLEVVNLVGIFTCFLLALRYSEVPDSLERFSSLIIAVALFSHARYESPFLVLPVLAVIAINWIRIRNLQITWTAALVPLSFVPIAWQHIYANSRLDFKQLKSESEAFFSLGYMSDNLGHAANFLFVPHRFNASAPLVAVIGVLSLVALIALNATRGREWAQRLRTLFVAQIFGIAILAEFLLILGFSYGQIDNPMVTRLGMPFIALTTICAAVMLSILATIQRRSRLVVYVTIAVCFFYAVQKYSNHLYTSNNMILKRIDWVVDRHEQLPAGNYLYLSYLSQEFELRGVGNMNIKRAISKAGSLEMHRALKTFDDIFVIQFFGQTFNEGQTETFLLPGNDLGPWFELETIDEVSMLPMNLTRLSRVTGIRSAIDEESGEDELLEKLLSTQHELIYEISQKSYNIWLDTLP